MQRKSQIMSKACLLLPFSRTFSTSTIADVDWAHLCYRDIAKYILHKSIAEKCAAMCDRK
jgi:hypothetical protein